MVTPNIDVKNQAYYLKMQEGHLNFAPTSSKGSIEVNIHDTMNSIRDQMNYLKTHPDMCTKDNVGVLVGVIQAVATQAKGSHQVSEGIKNEIAKMQKTIAHMK